MPSLIFRSFVTIALLSSIATTVFAKEGRNHEREQKSFTTGKAQCADYIENFRNKMDEIRSAENIAPKDDKKCTARNISTDAFKALCDVQESFYTTLSTNDRSAKPLQQLNNICTKVEEFRASFCRQVRSRFICGCDDQDPMCECLKNISHLPTWQCKDTKAWTKFTNLTKQVSQVVKPALERAESDLTGLPEGI